MAKFYISDLHLGHENCIMFDDRPFDSCEDMHRTIIHNWNNAVTDNDDIYILGDISMKPDIGMFIVPKLHGRKYLIQGNHDRLSDKYKKLFVWVKDMTEVKDNGHSVILCHYPITSWRHMRHGTYHLYGHVHNSSEWTLVERIKSQMIEKGNPYNCYNVGCMLDYMNYTPRTLEYIINNAF